MKSPATPRKRALIAMLAVLGVSVSLSVSAQDLVTSPTNKHNLSTTGPGPVKSTSMTEICVFCHTPHNANPAAPLWNQALSGSTYTTYTSTTMAATVGLPSGGSKLCLACHDGTIAIGNTMNNGQIANMQGLTALKLTGASNLGTNLRDDHPISFVPVTASDLVNPPGSSPIKLDPNGQVQCRTCHEPHQMDIDPTTKKFLVVNNSGSAMCLVCHKKQYWTSNPSTHMTSTKSYTATQGAHTGYTTVATNGCESCHRPHTAASAPRTLKAVEEFTCQQCHGNSPFNVGKNIQAEFAKPYRHPVYDVTPSVHDPTEGPTTPGHILPETSAAAPRHVECEDCHNPHASYATVAASPRAPGHLAGVWGMNTNNVQVFPTGTPPVVNEFEICYKCHGDSANKPQPAGPVPPYPVRWFPQFNKRIQFDPTNLSYHPVETTGKNATVPSLIAPWSTTSIVRCNDCHDNDTGPLAPTPGTGPTGTHGSNNQHILVANYSADTEYTTESATAYALCYKCHDRTRVRTNPGQFDQHGNHITQYQAACSICHDPHGVPNETHLVNFDTRYVQQANAGTPVKWTPGNNGCVLKCHNAVHPR